MQIVEPMLKAAMYPFGVLVDNTSFVCQFASTVYQITVEFSRSTLGITNPMINLHSYKFGHYNDEYNKLV